MERAPHPLETWRLTQGLTYAQLAQRCRQRGHSVKTVYVEQICRGWYRPGGLLALALAQASDGAVSADEILSFEYTSSKNRAAS